MSPDPAFEKYLPTGDKKRDSKLPANGIFNSINLNLYNYSNNNPVKYTDPDGQWAGVDDVITGPIDEVIVIGGLALLSWFGCQWAKDAIKSISETISRVIPRSREKDNNDYVYHATGSQSFADLLEKQGVSVIDLEKSKANENRFGKAFYVAEDPLTALAERPGSPLVLKFSMDKSNILDLTDPAVAQKYGYYKGMSHKEVSSLLKNIVLPDGKKAIKYWSEQNPGGINYAVKDPSILRFEGVWKGETK